MSRALRDKLEYLDAFMFALCARNRQKLPKNAYNISIFLKIRNGIRKDCCEIHLLIQ